EGEIDFSMLVTDYLGNQNTYSGSTDGSTVVYDKTPPELNSVTIVSDNIYDTTWAKVNDTISITFTPNEEISADFALSFDGIDDYIELPDGMVSSLNDFTFICWFNTNINDPWTRLIDFGSSTSVNMFLTPSYGGTNIPRFAIKQSGGGEQQITSSSPLNQGQWYHIAVTIDDNMNTGRMYLDGTLIAENNSMTIRPSSLGNTTNNYFGKSQYNDPYLDGMMDDISIWGRTLDQNEIQSSMYTSLNGDENGLISYWGLNEGSGGTTYDKSSNTNDGVLNNMDPTSAWFFQRGSVRTATIMSQDASISTINSNQFHANYTTTITDPEGDVQFEISFTDLAGNDGETVTSTTNNSRVIFDRTSPADFTVGTVVATGGNVVENAWNSTNTGLDVTVPVESDTTLKNGWIQVWTKVGNNAFEKLGDSTTIANSDVGTDKVISFTSEQVEAITGFAEQDSIYIKAVMNDRPGNETVGTESSSRLLIDETPPSLISATYESNFSDSSLATVGHVVTLIFETDVEIQTPSATISTQNGIISDLGSNRWSASYEMQDGDTEGVIPFQIGTLTDSRGNPTVGSSTTTDGTEVTFDNTQPTLNPVTILSDNPDTEWAKVGDTVTVTFTGEETLISQTASIVTQSATITDLGGQVYAAKYKMTVSDPEGEVAFEIIVTDRLEIDSDPVTQTNDGTAVIFDRTAPTLSMVHIESDNANNL
ncbi:MAG TPA: LamG domain-containing protein, partial [Candidatus Marinimicrobia bacterium]|nr:LamG domain-containing protein [Candidatus Neomarinimicrobiota bacterium]